MKNKLLINHTNRTIIMDRTFAKYAANTRSEEYAHLQRVRQDYPEYEVIRRKINSNNNKETYRGLTYEYMEDYILTHGTPEEIKKNLKIYDEKKLISECHSKARRYPVIKSWFLETFPEILKFGMNEDPKVVETENDVKNVVSAAPKLAVAS